MTRFVARLLGMEKDAARVVQKQLYRDHGTTLAGLVAVYKIDPEPYLAFVHDIDLSGLAPDPTLRRALARLPGRRFVFTNGCRNHAGRILERLQLDDLFDQIWDIRTIGFVPKPDPAAYDAAVTTGNIAPRKAAMFDDIARNLVVPHDMGMTTVWLDCQSDWSRQGPEFPVASSTHIDHEIRELDLFLNSIGI
jgi:putative hydrolase of the HAD superfamily